jgi:integrase
VAKRSKAPGELGKLTESNVADLEAFLEVQGRDLTKPQDVWDAGYNGLLLRREPSGHKSWHLRFTVHGRRTRMKLGVWPALSVTEARKAASVLTAKVAKGDDPVAEGRAQRDAVAVRRRQAKRNAAAVLGTFIEGPYREWAEGSLRSHADTLAALKADFGDGRTTGKDAKRKAGAGWWTRPMDSLTPMEVERWRRDQLKAGIQKATINRAWQRLRAVLGKAHEWNLIGAPPKVKRFRLDSRGRVRYLSADERARLIAALDAREERRRDERESMNAWLKARKQAPKPPYGTFTDHLKPLVLLVLNTGLRRGEALGLTWGAIDFKRGLVHVEAATSKSGQSRDMPMTTEARVVLTQLQDQQQPDDPRAYLFATSDGERLRSIGAKTWDALMEAAKLKDFRFHDLRHDYASRLVTAGVDLYSVSKLLGHSDVAMSQRYAHLAPDFLQAAVRKLDNPAVIAA